MVPLPQEGRQYLIALCVRNGIRGIIRVPFLEVKISAQGGGTFWNSLPIIRKSQARTFFVMPLTKFCSYQIRWSEKGSHSSWSKCKISYPEKARLPP